MEHTERYTTAIPGASQWSMTLESAGTATKTGSNPVTFCSGMIPSAALAMRRVILAYGVLWGSA